MQGFKSLKVWQRAHALVVQVYKATQNFPSQEKFGLVQQMRRAVVSIAANIAEGSKRRSRKDFAHFLNMAEGSLEELKYYFILSLDLALIEKEVFEDLLRRAEEIGKMLRGLFKKLTT